MTPTEQDKELREKLRVMIRGYLRDYTDSARDSLVYADEVLSLITQYGDTRERLGRIDERQMLSFHRAYGKDYQETLETLEEANDKRIAELKAQQEEV